MEELKKAEDLVGHAREYVNTRVDEVKLTVAEKSSRVIAFVIAGSAVSLVFAFCLFFASMALSYELGNLLGKNWLGFLLVAAFYCILGLIVWGAREKLIRIPVMNAIIHQLFKTDVEDEKD